MRGTTEPLFSRELVAASVPRTLIAIGSSPRESSGFCLPMTTYYLSTRKMTICIDTNAEGVIVATPPIVAKFKWQHIDRLRAWLVKQGGYKEFEIKAAPS